MRRGQFRLPDPDPDPLETKVVDDPEDVLLPSRPVLDAGMQKFAELAALHWPKSGGSISFDVKDQPRLMMTLGLVFLAMKQAEAKLK
jgi:hypothetical protein